MDSPFSPFPQSTQSLSGLPPVQPPSSASSTVPSVGAQSPLNAQFPQYSSQPTRSGFPDQNTTSQPLPISAQPQSTPNVQASEPFGPAVGLASSGTQPMSAFAPPLSSSSFPSVYPQSQPVAAPITQPVPSWSAPVPSSTGNVPTDVFAPASMNFSQAVAPMQSQAIPEPLPQAQTFQHPWDQPQAAQPFSTGVPSTVAPQTFAQPLPVQPLPAMQPQAPVLPQMTPIAQPTLVDSFAVSAPQPVQTPLQPIVPEQHSGGLFSQVPPSIDQKPPAPALSPETVHQAILSEIEQEELFGRERLSTWQKVVIVTIAILTLAVIAGGGVWVYITVTAPATQEAPIAGKDTDGDGLSDNEERNYGTDTKQKDTDGDGYSDFEEIKNGYSPLGK